MERNKWKIGRGAKWKRALAQCIWNTSAWCTVGKNHWLIINIMMMMKKVSKLWIFSHATLHFDRNYDNSSSNSDDNSRQWMTVGGWIFSSPSYSSWMGGIRVDDKFMDWRWALALLGAIMLNTIEYIQHLLALVKFSNIIIINYTDSNYNKIAK